MYTEIMHENIQILSYIYNYGISEKKIARITNPKSLGENLLAVIYGVMTATSSQTWIERREGKCRQREKKFLDDVFAFQFPVDEVDHADPLYLRPNKSKNRNI